MKRFLIIIFFLISGFSAFSQKENKLYLYGAVGLGFYKGAAAKVSVNSVFLKNNIVSGNYHFYNGNADNIPSDYIVGGGIRIYGNGLPDYNMMTWSLLYGKMLFPESSVRLAIKGGPTFGTVEYPYEFIPIQPTSAIPFGQTSNYTVVYKEKNVRGVILNSEVEFAFTKWWGMALGLQGNINNYKSLLRFEITTIFGKIRD